MTVQIHDYASAPFGAWDTTTEEPMADERANAVIRLQRPSIGCSPVEAELLVDEIGVDVIRSESDEQLAAQFAQIFTPAQELLLGGESGVESVAGVEAGPSPDAEVPSLTSDPAPAVPNEVTPAPGDPGASEAGEAAQEPADSPEAAGGE